MSTSVIPTSPGTDTASLKRWLRDGIISEPATLPTNPRNVAPTQCKASRRGRKTLRFDYKPPRISFSQLTELQRDRITFELEKKRGSESEAARLEREQREQAIESATGKVRLTPLLESAPKDCSTASR